MVADFPLNIKFFSSPGTNSCDGMQINSPMSGKRSITMYAG